MSPVCRTCSRVNPPEALYCYFDGVALSSHHQSGPVAAGAKPFPTPFVFPSGRQCHNFDELVRGCNAEWTAAQAALKEGFFEKFLRALGRIDLATAAHQAVKEADADRGLDHFLNKLPVSNRDAPKLVVGPLNVNLGQFTSGPPFVLQLENQGAGLLTGTLAGDDTDWLAFGPAPGTPQKLFQCRHNSAIAVHIVAKKLRAGNKPIEGRIRVESNGGTAVVTVCLEKPVRPFPEGVLAGTKSPGEIAAKARANPKEAAQLFEKGAVKAWYESNGWTYPVQGPSSSGLGAIQQFFEALGLVQPPKVTISQPTIQFQGAPGDHLEQAIKVETAEKRPVFAHATSSTPWLQIRRTILGGRTATIPIHVPSIPAMPGERLKGTVQVVSNGNQQFLVEVELHVTGQSSAVPVLDMRDVLATPEPVIPVAGRKSQLKPAMRTILVEPAPDAAHAARADALERLPAAPLAQTGPEAAHFQLKDKTLIGREPDRVDVLLPHPQVSRLHARIVLKGTTATLTDLNSANGTFVNGVRLQRTVPLQPGDQLDIGPYALQFTGTALIPRPRSDNVELVAHRIQRVVRNRETGKPLPLLDDITLVIRPREFVCLLGPSGSGKSTLLSALSGRAAADQGTVLLNGKDLYANFEALKQDIAVVPQKDVLHESLVVGQALWYTAKLRLPPDTSAAEIEASLDKMLDTVGLSVRRRTMIRHLSGGQVKRASLANEIMCKPSLLLLDEVTSGLDEQTDREMMNLFRSLADAGKTVVCITHTLANVDRTCHLVVILTAGGKLAFVGKPAEALEYFGIDRLGDVYDRLIEQPGEHWQQTFRKSPLWQRYVAERLPPDFGAKPAVQASASGAGGRARSFFRQTVLLTRRYAAIWRGDYPALLAMAGQAVVVGVLLGLLFGNLRALKTSAEKNTDPQVSAQKYSDYAGRSANLMFLLAVSSFWFGCNNAAKEIVKERTIYSRERDFNLLVSSYYFSKLFLLTIFSCFQTVLLFAIVCVWCGPPGGWLSELLVLQVLSLAGVTLGLAISALAATEEMAITLVPIAIIPQIILSGAIAPLEGLSKALALSGISTYWGKRGLDACLPEEVAKAVLPSALERHSRGVAVLVLLGHAFACIAVALIVLHWRSRRGRGLTALLGRPKN